MEQPLLDVVRLGATRPRDFDTMVDEFTEEVVRSVEGEMQHQPASMVYEILRMGVERRLPGIEVDHERLRHAAARIAAGVPARLPAPSQPSSSTSAAIRKAELASGTPQ
jgi:hypothetical protein